ncbi:hypothetical protein HYH03_011037 [Edaphochlamys debaryana]|uniref:Uncharacterized protein n=1 Tax=Edaphochlamys debaryana TaxID=47281 RepID=A0A836BW49_9CHLO|nr:hypothetical protein HYH03_011037 [Edaphochlamys debaryana]|eukprot:KAG2490647.1 hypothetical protein HYH03_011037 [Edaphochlamys debaryana]
MDSRHEMLLGGQTSGTVDPGAPPDHGAPPGRNRRMGQAAYSSGGTDPFHNLPDTLLLAAASGSGGQLMPTATHLYSSGGSGGSGNGSKPRRMAYALYNASAGPTHTGISMNSEEPAIDNMQQAHNTAPLPAVLKPGPAPIAFSPPNTSDAAAAARGPDHMHPAPSPHLQLAPSAAAPLPRRTGDARAQPASVSAPLPRPCLTARDLSAAALCQVLTAVSAASLPNLKLPQPVTVQVSSKKRKGGAEAAAEGAEDGRTTRGTVGVFYPQLYLTGGDCIESGGQLMSRGRFERLAGSATAKWHVSIKVVPSGMTLGKWLQQHGLPVLQAAPRKPKVCASTPGAVGAALVGEEGAEEDHGSTASAGNPPTTSSSGPGPESMGAEPAGRAAAWAAEDRSGGSAHAAPLQYQQGSADLGPLPSSGDGWRPAPSWRHAVSSAGAGSGSGGAASGSAGTGARLLQHSASASLAPGPGSRPHYATANVLTASGTASQLGGTRSGTLPAAHAASFGGRSSGMPPPAPPDAASQPGSGAYGAASGSLAPHGRGHTDFTRHSLPRASTESPWRLPPERDPSFDMPPPGRSLMAGPGPGPGPDFGWGQGSGASAGPSAGANAQLAPAQDPEAARYAARRALSGAASGLAAQRGCGFTFLTAGSGLLESGEQAGVTRAAGLQPPQPVPRMLSSLGGAGQDSSGPRRSGPGGLRGWPPAPSLTSLPPGAGSSCASASATAMEDFSGGGSSVRVAPGSLATTSAFASPLPTGTVPPGGCDWLNLPAVLPEWAQARLSGNGTTTLVSQLLSRNSLRGEQRHNSLLGTLGPPEVQSPGLSLTDLGLEVGEPWGAWTGGAGAGAGMGRGGGGGGAVPDRQPLLRMPQGPGIDPSERARLLNANAAMAPRPQQALPVSLRLPQQRPQQQPSAGGAAPAGWAQQMPLQAQERDRQPQAPSWQQQGWTQQEGWQQQEQGWQQQQPQGADLWPQEQQQGWPQEQQQGWPQEQQQGWRT